MPAAVLLTASQLDRLMRCPAGGLLPGVSEASEAAERGTAIHARLLRPGGLPGDFTRWLLGSYRPEDVTWFGYELAAQWEFGPQLPDERARFLRCGVPGRHYDPPQADGLAGTCDVAAMFGPRRLRVADLKTGHAQVYGGALPAPGDSWQLRSLAVLQWVALGRQPDTEVALAWLLWDDEEERGRVWTAERDYGVDDLREWELLLRGLVSRIASGEARPEFGRGAHCLRCSSFEFCPAQAEAVTRLSDALEVAASGSLSPQQLATAWRDLQATERLAELARAQLLAHVARRGSVDLAADRELVPATQVIRRIRDPARVRAAAARVGASVAVRDVVTVASVRAGFGRGKEAEADGFLRQLEEEGAIVRETSRAFLQERRRRPQ